MAEWLRRGLQILLSQFDSGRGLQISCCFVLKKKYVEFIPGKAELKWSIPNSRWQQTIENPLYNQIQHMGIVELMLFVDQKTGYLNSFTHISATKEKSPVNKEDLIACILANGTNYGLYKMANISDRSMGKLRSVDDSYVRYETLKTSNDQVSNAIATLPIFAYYHVDDNQLFSKVNIENKFGVDPIKGGNIRKTSDVFFSTNKKKFDLIFIDGLHVYSQVKKDILNSLKCLNNNGIILVHDCLPDSLSKQAVPRYKMTWNGDVWKAIVDLRKLDSIEIYTCKIDQGISIIQNKKNSSVLNIDKDISKLKFKDFYYNHNLYMRIISKDEFKNKF